MVPPLLWVILSDLRFQSDAALLLCVMIVINGFAAMLLVPAWVLVFKPKFIVNVYSDEDGVLYADGESAKQPTTHKDVGDEGGSLAGNVSRA